MTVYIQSRIDQTNSKIEFPYNHESACAVYGAIDNEMPFELLTYADLITGDYDNLIRENLFVGSVEFMQEVFRRIGLENIRLPLNSNRPSERMTLGEAFEMAKTKEIFIKPVGIKLFTGLVLDGARYKCLDNIPNDTEVFAYDVFEQEIMSEWRVYVYNGEVEDIRNYSGAVDIFPSKKYIDMIVWIEYNVVEFDRLPATHTVDIGILADDENVIIEFNDMWAIGNYGVPNDIYVNMLRHRYFDIIRNGK